jgi:hypothetical protein
MRPNHRYLDAWARRRWLRAAVIMPVACLASEPLHAQFVTSIAGQLTCATAGGPHGGDELAFIGVMAGNAHRVTTDPNGRFVLPVKLASNRVDLRIEYEGKVEHAPEHVASRLQVMDEGHAARSDLIGATGQASGSTLDLGTVALNTVDCELWRIGVTVLQDYHGLMHESPPAGQLRLKRWSGVTTPAGSNPIAPYTQYDYVSIPTDFMQTRSERWRRECTVFHEFGHTIRHVLDGDENHFNFDVGRFAYARTHGDEITNIQFAFNEGWAHYWEAARHGAACRPNSSHTVDNRDWNENLVGQALLGLSVQSGAGEQVMIEVLRLNPGSIHSLHEFETALARRLSHAAPPAPADCPPNYRNDGATCRRDVSEVVKESRTRGAGRTPDECAPGEERDAGLCYPACRVGFHGVGPVCWQACPAGATDDGGTCRMPGDIRAKASYGRGAGSIPFPHCNAAQEYDAGLCYTKCNEGYHGVGPVCWGTCQPGYVDDGGTCRKDPQIVAKVSYGRGAGHVGRCAAGEDEDAGLCYARCLSGFHGVGPVCWSDRCPDGYDDHGGTCFRNASVIIRF